MTPARFKIWFAGFSEAITDRPTFEQWAIIKMRVAELGGDDKDKQSSKQHRGGIARANALTPERRTEIAKAAANARWNHS
jgi:hypothetical protein